MDLWATKTLQERQDEEDKRLVRPSPSTKPPRRELRRERVQPESDPDLDDTSDHKDRSKNFKDVGGSIRDRIVRRFAAEDRIPAKNRETGKTVQISPDTLKERPGEYEAVDKTEEGSAPKPSVKDYGTAAKDLRTLAKDNPKLKDTLKSLTTPGAYLAKMVKENPDFDAATIFRGITLPKELKTLQDVLEALTQDSPEKTEEVGPKTPKQKSPKTPKEEPKTGDPSDPPSEKSEEVPRSEESPTKSKKPKTPKKVQTEAGKAGLAPPKRRAVTSADQEEAISLLADTFSPSVASSLMASNLHPDDVKTLVRDYTSAKDGLKVRNVEDLASKVRAFYQPNPDKVPPPTEGLNAQGEKVAFDKLLPDEQSEALKQHQLKIAALSLAAKEALTAKISDNRALTGTPRVPRSLAGSLARELLQPSANVGQAAAKMFDNVLKSGVEMKLRDEAVNTLLDRVKDSPSAHAMAVAALQANDYAMAKTKYLKGDDTSLSEWQEPEDIVKGLAKVGKFFNERNELYGAAAEHPSAKFFRLKVLGRLKVLSPKKAKAVTRELPQLEMEEYEDQHQAWQKLHSTWEGKKAQHEASLKAYTENPEGKKPPGAFTQPEPIQPSKPVGVPDKARGAELWKEVLEPAKAVAEISEADLGEGTKKTAVWRSNFTYPTSLVMGSDSKTSVYHGVDPYSYGPAAYPGWLQPHQRDLGEADYSLILQGAQEWLASPLLSVAVEGMVPDARFRAALDLAIVASPYNGAINVSTYNKLLAKLAGEPEPGRGETLLTVQAKQSSYETDRMDLMILGLCSVDAETIRAITTASFKFLDASGTEVEGGTVSVLGVCHSSVSHQERQGMVVETVVSVDFPRGASENVLRALNAALGGMKVAQVLPGHVPQIRKMTADDTFTFIPPSDGDATSMRASVEVRNMAAKTASTNSKLALELVALADRLAESETQQEGEEQRLKEASTKHQSLRSLVIKQASTVALGHREPWIPVLQAIKNL